MKRRHLGGVIILWVIFSILSPSPALPADDKIEGKITKIEVMYQTLEIDQFDQITTVYYTNKTKFPKGITDISMLIGQDVKITLDEMGYAGTIET